MASYLYQVHLYHWLEANDYGRFLSDSDLYKALRVFSRSAVLAFRDKPVTPAQVGQQLNAIYLLEGSLRRDADRLRITAKLVETRSGHCVWAERYDRKL